jgi:hypothetical protein
MCLHLTVSTSSACKLGQVSTQTKVTPSMSHVGVVLPPHGVVSKLELELDFVHYQEKKKNLMNFLRPNETAHVARGSARRSALYPAHVRHGIHFVRSGTGDGTNRA